MLPMARKWQNRHISSLHMQTHTFFPAESKSSLHVKPSALKTTHFVLLYNFFRIWILEHCRYLLTNRRNSCLLCNEVQHVYSQNAYSSHWFTMSDDCNFDLALQFAISVKEAKVANVELNALFSIGQLYKWRVPKLHINLSTGHTKMQRIKSHYVKCSPRWYTDHEQFSHPTV
jgi:hypothetical protein